jgi:hypothetical protein
MGTYLFNFHVRADHRDAVGGALATLGRAFPAYVSDAKNGWVSVYPSNAKELTSQARKVSELLGCVVLAFEVYDSDECRAVVYNQGRRVARRRIGPEVDDPEPGDPKRFAKYASAGATERFRAILAEKPTFAEETAYALAGAFGVSDDRVEFSYEWAKGTAPPPGVVHVAP